MAERPARKMRVVRRWSRARKARRDVALIAESGLFDQAWYELQLRNRTFSSVGSAIRHYLRTGRRSGLSPHPYFLPSWYDPATWRTTRRDPLLRFLQNPGGGSPHPLFHPKRYLSSHPEARDHPLGPLGHFLAHASPDAVMPTRLALPQAVSRAAAERGLWAGLAQHSHDMALDRSARQRRWDESRETALRRRHADNANAARAARTTPFVSVLMPVKDRSGQVGAAIESVLAQTEASWELLIVDDGSTDSTPDVLRRYAESDARIRVTTIPTSRGVSFARNTALSEASGEFVAFLDSDNTWTPDFLALMTGEMKRVGARLAHSVVRGDQDGIVWYRAATGGLDELLLDNFIDLNALVVGRPLLAETGGFDESLRRMVDWDLVIRLARIERPYLVPFVGVDYDDSRQGRARITTTEPRGWREVILSRQLIDWEEEQRALRHPDRVSVVIPTYDDWEMTTRAVTAVLQHSEPFDVEVVVVDNGSSAVPCQLLTATLSGIPQVQLVRVPRNCQFALGSNLGFAASTGQTVVFLNNDTVVQAGWLPPLLEELARSDAIAVQPLLLFPDGTIQCAGIAFPDRPGLPSHFLAEHPIEDATALGTFSTWAVTGAALMIDASRFAAARGFDPIYSNGWEDVDLCLRVGAADTKAFRVVTASRVTHFESRSAGRSARIDENRRTFMGRWSARLPSGDTALWRSAGFDVPHFVPDPPAPADPGRARVSRPLVVRRHQDRLRWAIKCAAPAGPQGAVWGDTHFAHALARSLRRLGQDVVVDRLEAHQRATSYLDDVVLNLRGLEDFSVQPGRVNLMWVISHPELVTPAEVMRYDAVFAASVAWSKHMSSLTGTTVQPLLQATDPALFRPERMTPSKATGVLFVGSSRNVLRRVVDDAVRADLPLTIHGPRWERFYPDADFLLPAVPYESVGELYASADIVLNDHWDEMARMGFVSNRVFDAVASGARVVSDPVEGLGELFGGAVQTYRDLDDLRSLAGSDRERRFPSSAARHATADRVRKEHSFDNRARVLLEAAQRLA